MWQRGTWFSKNHCHLNTCLLLYIAFFPHCGPHPKGKLPSYPRRCIGSGHILNKAERLERGWWWQWQVKDIRLPFHAGLTEIPLCSKFFHGSQGKESQLSLTSEALQGPAYADSLASFPMSHLIPPQLQLCLFIPLGVYKPSSFCPYP